MGKYDKAKEKIREEKEFKKEQRALHKKYKIENENIIIKEKSNFIQFLINTGGQIIRIIASIILYILAAIGLISLLYPTSRAAVIDTLISIFQEILMLI